MDGLTSSRMIPPSAGDEVVWFRVPSGEVTYTERPHSGFLAPTLLMRPGSCEVDCSVRPILAILYQVADQHSGNRAVRHAHSTVASAV